MIEKISITHYRKLKNIDFDFSPKVNIISGTNGTCKSSLLHIISNSFQKVLRTATWVNNKACLEIIKQLNNLTNPKIESLTRGDKQYNNPAKGQAGTLYTVKYINGKSTEFRKHNSETAGKHRYAIKPYYKKGFKESLLACPIIYLGLGRLLPYGEFQNDSVIKNIKKSLPDNYKQLITELYKDISGIKIVLNAPEKMGDIKIRHDFTSDQDGIDSNTISAGEDNLFILIAAVVSLKYYFECITSNNNIESILLIDELDATLHPSLQFKILNLFNEYSKLYKIQIIFTTHSLSLVEEALNKKDNVIYLYDNLSSVKKFENPDIYKIKMYLHGITRSNIYVNKRIPIFMEDEEARFFLNIVFDYFQNEKPEFAKIRHLFHTVDASFGAENLAGMFNDSHLIKFIMPSICILDGDQKSRKNLTKCIITLPGDDSPEELVMAYANTLFENDDDTFWLQQKILDENYGKIQFRDSILPDIQNIQVVLSKNESSDKSNKGVRRALNKEVFNKHKDFFELVSIHWAHNKDNKQQLYEFYKDLNIMFKKIADFHGINSKDWNLEATS